MTYLPQRKAVALKTTQEAVLHYADPQNCIDYMVRLRWPDGKITCPTCGSLNVSYLPTRFLFQCKARHPKRQFSVKVGTVLENSPIALGKWLLVMWLLTTCRNGISSYEVARTIGITQKSAWFMLHRLREAMADDDALLSGVIEGDETYVGGREKNRHIKARKGSAGRSTDGKVPVFGLVERGGRVVASALPNAKEASVLPVIHQSVDNADSVIVTDDFPIYDKLTRMGYNHAVITHTLSRYVSGMVHTNTIENFWSCLKRTLRGTYIAVTRKHLNAYVTEQAFRFNVRKGFTEQQRSIVLIHGIQGKRLTYKQLIARAA